MYKNNITFVVVASFFKLNYQQVVNLSLFNLFFSLNVNNSIVFGEIHNLILPNEDINIVVAGDYYCNDETEYTIENIISVNPELIITTGDHDKDVKSIKC